MMTQIPHQIGQFSYVPPVVLTVNPLKQLLDLVILSMVNANSDPLAPPPRDLSSTSVQLLLGPPRDVHLCPGLSQLDGDATADALSGPGHQAHLPRQVRRHFCLVIWVPTTGRSGRVTQAACNLLCIYSHRLR